MPFAEQTEIQRTKRDNGNEIKQVNLKFYDAYTFYTILYYIFIYIFLILFVLLIFFFYF